MDITGDENKFGKVTGGDLIEGKKTYLLLKALEVANGNDKKMLIKLVNNKGILSKKVTKYKEIYNRLGILEEANKEIERNTKQALNCLNFLEDKEKDKLVWLANFLLNRTN